MSEKIEQQEDIHTVSIAEDMLYFGKQTRNIYEIVKNKIIKLIFKK